ncbi:MAG TPA: right-handed parallel beta-helix repeat-containing protein [Gemmataceae bacterium]|jgi:hypothetical protein
MERIRINDLPGAESLTPEASAKLFIVRWLCSLRGRLGTRRPAGRARPAVVPRLESLEDRVVPSTFLVTSLADSGTGSLRQAVSDANAKPGADLIRFSPGLTGTIRLSSGQLDVTDDLTITGPGATQLAVSGSGLSRVLHVAPGVAADVSGLTVTGGRIANFGGGILNEGDLSLSFCRVVGNEAFARKPDEESAGGGISNTGTMTVRFCEIASNTLTGTDNPSVDGVNISGGGISSAGAGASLIITDSSISFNTAPNAGGLRIAEGSTLTFAHNLVEGNTALQTLGGGIGIDDAPDTTLTDSIFRDNRVLGNDSVFGAFGGGLHNEHSNTTVINCVFEGNSSAGFGGGLDNFAGTLTVRDSSITGNSAVTGGGLANVFGGSKMVLEGSSVEANTASADGGGVASAANPTFGSPALLEVRQSVLSGNTAGGNGGGVSFASGDALILNDVLITRNRASRAGGTGRGGGLYVGTPPATEDLTGAVIVLNSPDNVFRA